MFRPRDPSVITPFDVIIHLLLIPQDAANRGAYGKLFLFFSSGVLIILPASGNGEFGARFGNAKAQVRGLVSTSERNNKTYLHVDTLDVHLTVKDVNMRVRKIFNNNRILSEFFVIFL